jgi:hypothetical protein
MKAFDFLKLDPKDVKVHLAVWNGKQDPIDQYFNGTFKRWQEHQTKQNFKRKKILSLIRYQRKDLWLFAGVYDSLGSTKLSDGIHQYRSELNESFNEFNGRLILNYKRTGRVSYPYGESICDKLLINEIKPTVLAFSDFENYKNVCLNRSALQTMFEQNPQSWKTALSAVSGVYLMILENPRPVGVVILRGLCLCHFYR